MTEYYKAENEMIAAYGDESSKEEVQQENGSTNQYFEGVEPSMPEVEADETQGLSREQIEVREEMGVIEEAAQYIEALPGVERLALDKLAGKQAEILDYTNSESIVEKEVAEFSVLGSAFAAAPTNSSEAANPPSWKRVLGGATKGAKVATIAVAMALPLTSHSQEKEDPAVTYIVNQLYGTSVKERITGKREADKARYAQLEAEKRALVRELGSTFEPSPRNEAERTRFKLLEATRDRKLAEIKEQKARFIKEVMHADLNDPEVVAYIEKKEAQFKELRLKVISEFEDAIMAEMKNRIDKNREDEIRHRINLIDKEQSRMSEREIYQHNRRSTYYY